MPRQAKECKGLPEHNFSSTVYIDVLRRFRFETVLNNGDYALLHFER